MRRLTDEELEWYERALKRALGEEGFAAEDRPILERVQQLYEQVADELTSAS
jgi:transposase